MKMQIEDLRSMVKDLAMDIYDRADEIITDDFEQFGGSVTVSFTISSIIEDEVPSINIDTTLYSGRVIKRLRESHPCT